MLKTKPEILAPAGSEESLIAAVRTGADAVYLGGKSLNARRGAANFDAGGLAKAARYCRARGVKVYQTVNTVVFDDEFAELEETLETACAAGADAVIVQDLAVAAYVRENCPSLPLFASTQIAVHNLDGVKMLEQLGFSRAVLARELSFAELEYIAARSTLELEVFVHGALCMCISGQCYLSSMIGTRSGNRGLCAQPCRLPFKSKGSSHALSLKDLSAVEMIPKLAGIGIAGLKIEGRLKRPEYAAAAVTACRRALDGEKPRMDELRAVFSRGGFTNGYLEGRLGDEMFGVRGKDDVSASARILPGLAALYAKENPIVPVFMELEVKENKPALLRVKDSGGAEITVTGAVPQPAETAPLNPERAGRLLAKTGGTPFLPAGTEYKIGEGLMLPASAINFMRREALSQLEEIRGKAVAHPYKKQNNKIIPAARRRGGPRIRVHAENTRQLTGEILEGAQLISLPLCELQKLPADIRLRYGEKLSVRLPRFRFGGQDDQDTELLQLKDIKHASVGNLWAIGRAKAHGFTLHGDFSLNITNSMAIDEYRAIGLADAVLSIEMPLSRIRKLASSMPVGILAYGYLPLMAMRSRPAGLGEEGALTDRLGNCFTCRQNGQVTELLNTAPLYLADRLKDWKCVDFCTLYFTAETPEQCGQIWRAYAQGLPADGQKTRGLYYREVK
ncbi:MAG: DUF3656 domain-containing protein [Oscillospiraceae bacterium]|nr:DUF3656 domain-containing protein [Oscillospiraceae bacterium]